MITKLYSFYDTPYDHDVCHLFEHIVLRGFLMKLARKGYDRAFFGWLNGDTVDSTIFFDLGAYSKEVIGLFDTYLSGGVVIDDDLIYRAIGHIEAEMSSTVTIADNALLKRQLQGLATIIKGGKGSELASCTSPLKVTYTPRRFEEIAILINVFTGSRETQKAFLGLHPAIMDIVRDAAIDQEAAYPTGKSSLVVNDDGIGLGWRFIVKKGADLRGLTEATTRYVQQLDLTNYTKGIGLYRESIGHDVSYSQKTMEYYKQTGIQTNRDEIARLISVDTMRDIMNAISIRFVLLRGDLKKVEWGY